MTIIAAMCAAGARVAAQTTVMPPAPPDKSAAPVVVRVDSGYVNTSGNTEVATLSVTAP